MTNISQQRETPGMLQPFHNRFQSAGYPIGERGCFLNLNPLNPRIRIAGIEWSLKQVCFSYSVDGQEKVFVYSNGKAIDNTGILPIEPSDQRMFGLYLGNERTYSDREEPIDSGIGLYFLADSIFQIFSPAHPDKVFQFASLYVETETFGFVANALYNANGNFEVFWKLIEDRIHMGLYSNCNQIIAQLIAKYNKSNILPWMGKGTLEGRI